MSEPDPLDIVHPVGEKKETPDTVSSSPEQPSLFERITKVFWNFAPGILAVLATLYLLQGYVKAPNYAADSKGLNDRITITENTSIPQINQSLAGLIQQINIISTNISSMSAKEQGFATVNLLTDANANIAKLQGDLKNVSGNLQALQVSVALLTPKTANTTSNVTGNITK